MESKKPIKKQSLVKLQKLLTLADDVEGIKLQRKSTELVLKSSKSTSVSAS